LTDHNAGAVFLWAFGCGMMLLMLYK
jgi:hypothetical protein